MLGPGWLPYGPEDTLLSLVSMHFYAAKQRYLEAVAVGAGMFLDRPGQIDIRPYIDSGTVNAVYGTVFHAEALMQTLPAGSSEVLAGLRALMIGGSTVSMDLREKIRRTLTPRLYLFYGTNETHTSTIAAPDEVFSLPGGVGRALPGFRLKVVDPGGRSLPAGQDGEILIRSPASIDSYLDADAESRAVFRRGWFATGDVGALTADGQLVHKGRSDGMLIVSGVNLYPAEVEQILRRCEGVADAHVTAMHHPALQDVPVALVVPAPGERPDEQALVAKVREQLGAHALFRVFRVDRIPRNEQGKVQRLAVKELLQSAQESGAAASLGATADVGGGSVMRVAFVMPAKVDLDRFDAWLRLLGQDPDAVEKAGISREGQDQAARVWLGRVLRFAQLLLQAVRVPSFDTPVVLSCQPESGARRYVGSFRMSGGEFHSRRLMEDILKQAFAMAGPIGVADSADPAHRQQFFTKIVEGVVKRHSRSTARGKSTFEVLRAAWRRGIPCLALPGGAVQLGWGVNSRRIERSTTERDSALGMMLTDNKQLTAKVLRDAGLPGPLHQLVRSEADAREAAQRIGFPLVIKPADLERGEGVTVDVTPDSLAEAFANAFRLSPRKQVLVERQADGVCHRLFIACGRLLYAVKRLPIGVYGDGKSTVSELVTREFAKQCMLPPWIRTPLRPIDDLAAQMLERDGLTPGSVPSKGRFVRLRRIESTAWGGVDEEVTGVIHPENLRVAVEAVAQMNLEVAGVDIISADISLPWYANDAIINEVNYAPLLGGGDISRTYLNEYLDRLLVDGGRIPVEVFLGGSAAWDAAKRRLLELRDAGHRTFLTSASTTLDDAGEELRFAGIEGLCGRTRALVLRRDVGALILVVQTDELLQTSLPLDRVDVLVHVDSQLKAHGSEAVSLGEARSHAVAELCRRWAES
jgi:D-alanine-D-alanine ligase-like ATP-grasp enzyme